ncbi:MAG: hypothetical protein PHD37_12700 [Gallionellaceae bacterium]|nr:hypothetical protein [Gallionellaceae bacterium]
MAEQFTFDDVFRQGAAIDRHERMARARPQVINGARRQLLAGAGLALDQDRGVDLGDALYPGDCGGELR